MPAFPGFPSGKTPYVPLPELFFSQIVPKIEEIGELKVVLHLFWLLYRKAGTPRCASDRELSGDPLLRRALRRLGDPRSYEERLRAALEAALAHNILLRVRVRVDDEVITWYFFNTERSRRAVAELLHGEVSPEILLDLEDGAGTAHLFAIELDRPNIFTLYEQNVGLLLPLVAEELREAEERYPREWIEEAFRQAVQQNKRKWSYIRAILRRWETDGKGA
jgi:DnaD/phage-associated family protein